MKKLTILALFAFLFFNLTFSQTIVMFPDRTFTRENGLNKAIDEDDLNIKGSKYINSKYQQANLSTHPDILFNVRYNAFNDDIEIEGKEKTSYALNKYNGTIIVAFLSGENFINSKYTDKNNAVSTGFFQVLSRAKDVFLLKKERVTIKEKEEAKTTYHKDKPAKYVRKDAEYYLKINNGYASKIPKKNKEFANLFGNDKESILKYIKTNKLKLKKEDDLIKIFKHIESLNPKK